jgi:hypothetical protein
MNPAGKVRCNIMPIAKGCKVLARTRGGACGRFVISAIRLNGADDKPRPVPNAGRGALRDPRLAWFVHWDNIGASRKTKVSLGFLLCYTLEAPARPGLSFIPCASAGFAGWLHGGTFALRAASLVRIEQQLTQGDENNDADNRRKEYGREENG